MNTRFFPGELWPDTSGVPINAHGGGILFHKGIYYWYGEHKIAGEAGNVAEVGVHVYASADLLNWEDKGIALAVINDPASEITRGCIMERPKVIYNEATAKFVMWFHLEPKGGGYSGARSGVAVSDTPTGPFLYRGSLRPNAGYWPENLEVGHQQPLHSEELEKLESLKLAGGPAPGFPQNLVVRRDFASGQMARDMTLFVDDDSIAYHVFASEENGTLHISQLSGDYLQPAGRYIRVFPGRFNEAPAMFKHEGRYFLISSGCTGWAPNEARLLRASSIWGPWEELPSPCIGTEEEVATTFDSQSAYVLPVSGIKDTFIFMADRWMPLDAIDGRYVWLPIQFQDGNPVIRWEKTWDLSWFDRIGSAAQLQGAYYPTN